MHIPVPTNSINYSSVNNDFSYKYKVLDEHNKTRSIIIQAYASGLQKELVTGALESVKSLIAILSPYMDKKKRYYFGVVKNGVVIVKGIRQELDDYIKQLYKSTLDMNKRVDAMQLASNTFEEMSQFFSMMGITPLSKVTAYAKIPEPNENIKTKKRKFKQNFNIPKHLKGVYDIVTYDIEKEDKARFDDWEEKAIKSSHVDEEKIEQNLIETIETEEV